jgi:hypothetical protein
LIHTPLQVIDLDLKGLVLLLESIELGLQGQQMGLHRTRGLLPFFLGKWESPS